MDQDIKLLIKILDNLGRHDLSNLIHNAKSYIEESTWYSNDFYNSRCATFIICVPLKQLEKLEKLSEDDQGLILKCISRFHPPKDNSTIISSIGFEMSDVSDENEDLILSLEKISIENSFDLKRHISRLRNAINFDPESTIGTTKEMLESVMKTILEQNNIKLKKNMPMLLKQVQEVLKIRKEDVLEKKGVDAIVEILEGLEKVVINVNRLRNLHGTGHGRSKVYRLDNRLARLVANSGITLAIFLMDTHEDRKSRGDLNV